jgi:hypothetical protein
MEVCSAQGGARIARKEGSCLVVRGKTSLHVMACFLQATYLKLGVHTCQDVVACSVLMQLLLAIALLMSCLISHAKYPTLETHAYQHVEDLQHNLGCVTVLDALRPPCTNGRLSSSLSWSLLLCAGQVPQA